MFYFKQIEVDTICSGCTRIIPANAHHLLSFNNRRGRWVYCYLCAINKGFPNVEFKRYDYDSRITKCQIYWRTYSNLLPSTNLIKRGVFLP